MKKMLGAAVAAIALLSAGPALAQSVGGVIGGVAGNANGTTHDAGSMTIDNSTDLSIDIDRSLSVSSGSGFGASFDLQGGSTAAFNGTGLAGSLVAGIGGPDGGAALSLSGNYGDYAATTTGQGKIFDAQVMNFGQGNYTNSFTASFDASHDFDATTSFENNSNWAVSGAAIGGFAGFSW